MSRKAAGLRLYLSLLRRSCQIPGFGTVSCLVWSGHYPSESRSVAGTLSAAGAASLSDNRFSSFLPLQLLSVECDQKSTRVCGGPLFALWRQLPRFVASACFIRGGGSPSESLSVPETLLTVSTASSNII